jgi:hypothetical protein
MDELAKLRRLLHRLVDEQNEAYRESVRTKDAVDKGRSLGLQTAVNLTEEIIKQAFYEGESGG